MEGRVYQEVLSNYGIEAMIPQAERRERINALIFTEIQR
jgi:aspartate/glutamate racemase